MLVMLIAFLTSVVLCVLSVTNVVEVSFIPFLMLAIATFLVFAILFYKRANRFPLNDISEYDKFDWRKFLNNTDDNNIVLFEKIAGVWVCGNGEKKVTLDLTGYLFPKSYLISYVVRNLRYPLISKKLPLKYLFQNSFPIKKKIDIRLVVIDGHKRKEITIVKNGVTKYGFVSQQITLSAFYWHLFSNYSYQRIRHLKTYIDENEYKNFHKK